MMLHFHNLKLKNMCCSSTVVNFGDFYFLTLLNPPYCTYWQDKLGSPLVYHCFNRFSYCIFTFLSVFFNELSNFINNLELPDGKYHLHLYFSIVFFLQCKPLKMLYLNIHARFSKKLIGQILHQPSMHPLLLLLFLQAGTQRGGEEGAVTMGGKRYLSRNIRLPVTLFPPGCDWGQANRDGQETTAAMRGGRGVCETICRIVALNPPHTLPRFSTHRFGNTI